MTENELHKKLDSLGPVSDETRNEIVCALIGHSRIQTFCFGYFNCARCGEQLGDTSMGVYPGAETAVIVGHDCPTCRENAKSLSWKDTIFCPDPFKKEATDESN